MPTKVTTWGQAEKPPVQRTRLRLAVDFHGVLCSYRSGAGSLVPGMVSPDPPVSGAIDWLNQISREFDVYIFSGQFADPETRDVAMKGARLWLVKNGLPDEIISIEPEFSGAVILSYTRPKCFMSIDDRAFTFRGK